MNKDRLVTSKELEVMLRRGTLILVALALMPVTLQARLQSRDGSPESQLQKQAMRIFVDCDESVIPTVIEEMRKRAGEAGFRIAFVSKSTDAYDARLILTFGTGKAWDTDPNIRPGDIRFPVPFAFGTAVALTPEGKDVFAAAQSGSTIQSASVAIAREIIKKLYRNSGAMGEKQNATDFREQHSHKLGALEEAKSSSGSPIPGEPGIYYKAPDAWVRLEQASPSAVEHRGVGTALLTWGLSGVSTIQLYEGAQSRLQIQDRKPTFYVRGFGVSEQGGEIVRLAKKKGHREILAASIKPFNAKAGHIEHDVDEVVVARVSSDVIAITPRTELKTGEYLLSFARLDLSYDFGISPDKK
jgi:hypothetical protein